MIFYVNFKETLINKTPVKPVRKKNVSLDRNMVLIGQVFLRQKVSKSIV